MAEAPIRHDEIIEDGLFDPTIESGKELEVVLDKLIDQFKEIASVTGKKIEAFKPTSVQEIKEYQQNIQKVDTVEKAHNQTLRTKIELQEANRKASQAIRDQIRGENSAWAELNNRYKEAVQRARDLGAQHGITSKEFKEAATSANTLNNELKAIDQATGNYQRNVGNYNNQLGTLARSVKGFGGLGIIISNALGIDPIVFHSIKEAGLALRDLNHIKSEENLIEGANTAAKGLNKDATVAETIAQEGQTIAVEGTSTALKAFRTALIATGIGLCYSRWYFNKQLG